MRLLYLPHSSLQRQPPPRAPLHRRRRPPETASQLVLPSLSLVNWMCSCPSPSPSTTLHHRPEAVRRPRATPPPVQPASGPRPAPARPETPHSPAQGLKALGSQRRPPHAAIVNEAAPLAAPPKNRRRRRPPLSNRRPQRAGGEANSPLQQQQAWAIVSMCSPPPLNK
jgi:hypothetical protein